MKFLNVLLICLLAWSGPLLASHFHGGDISWTYLGQDTFLVKVRAFRDCNSTPLAQQSFSIYTSTNSSSVPDTILLMAKTGAEDITPICSASCDRCGDISCAAFPMGTEEYTYEVKVNFKFMFPNNCKFKLAWNAFPRSGNITTGSGGENIYLEADINTCLSPVDQSPVFKNNPILIFNLGQCHTFSCAAEDPDVDAQGHPDSLVYYLDKPMQSPSKPATFFSGYTYLAPLKYTGSSPTDPWVPNCLGFHLDTLSGELKFKPQKEEGTVVDILVEEWGRDSSGQPFLKGKVRREMAIIILADNNNLPMLSGIDAGGTYETDYCVGETKCFKLTTFDADTADSITLTKSFPAALSGATIKVQGQVKHPDITFCWTPDSAAGGKSFNFTLTASDNHCPLVGRAAHVYTLHVHPKPYVYISDSFGHCGEVFYHAQALNSISNYTWTGDDSLHGSGTNLRHQYPGSGAYSYQLALINNYGCTDTLSSKIEVQPYPIAEPLPKDTSLVRGEAIYFKNVSSGAQRYLWYFGDGAQSAEIAPGHYYSDTGIYLVSMLAYNAQGCSDSQSIKVNIMPANIYIPDAFTPDENKLNDCFAPIGESIQSYTLEVYNRQGVPVYKSHQCWNGNIQGFPAAIGVYYYRLFVQSIDGKQHYFKGRFELLR